MSLAQNYARALFESLPEKDHSAKTFEKYSEELDGFVDLIATNKDLQIALCSGIVSGAEKEKVVSELCESGKISPVIKGFLELLARKGRLDQLAEVRSALREVRLHASGGIVGRVTSADSLDVSDLDALADAFSTKLGKTIEFEANVEPQLLAGLKVTVNGVTYDGTLKAQLESLKERFIQAGEDVH